MAKLAGLPRPNGRSNPKAFDNFSSSRSWDDTEWNWSRCDEIRKTSLLKYVSCKRRRIHALIRVWVLEPFFASWHDTYTYQISATSNLMVWTLNLKCSRGRYRAFLQLISGYRGVDVFGAGFLWSMRKLGQIRRCTLELQQLSC